VVDYRKFLGKVDVVVAPWWGGRNVDAPGRRLKLAAPPEKAGWYEFELKGRIAHVKGPAEAPSLDDRPRVRGFLWRERLVIDGALAEPVRLLPEEEAARFSPATARRWHGGGLIFEGLEFESEAEGAVREALGTGASLRELKGVPAPLRAAFAFALIEQTARKMGVPVAPLEVRGHVVRVSDEGAAGAEAVVRALIAEREQTEREMRELRARVTAAQNHADLEAARQARVDERRRRGDDAEARAESALDKAGADLESTRRTGPQQLEVVFAFMGERFVSIVDQDTLRVLDSGICLGHPPADELVTLDSLPGVIREAIETHRLVILREP
jgi:hypothetical protein